MKKPNLNKNEKSIDDLKIIENLKKIKHKIAVISGKGGVGKSTVAVNLAFELSMHGADTGLLDADIHGPSTLKMLCIENRQFIGDVHRGNLDYLIIDMPPGTGDEPLSIVTKIEHFVMQDTIEKEVVI